MDEATRQMTTPVVYVMPPQVYQANTVLDYCRSVEWGPCGADGSRIGGRELTAQEELMKAAALDLITDWLTGRRNFAMPMRPAPEPAAPPAAVPCPNP